MAALPTSADAALIGDRSRSPVGWIDFCKDNPADCETDLAQPLTINIDGDDWKRITGINMRVNADIEPVTDMDHWGVIERWSYPTDGKGDCEDYALEKRRRLSEAGFPRRALLMTVVLDEAGGGHAVLMVRTNRGDFVLDNRRNTILAWSATDYRYVKREGQAGLGWVAMSDPQPAPTVATAAR